MIEKDGGLAQDKAMEAMGWSILSTNLGRWGFLSLVSRAWQFLLDHLSR